MTAFDGLLQPALLGSAGLMIVVLVMLWRVEAPMRASGTRNVVALARTSSPDAATAIIEAWDDESRSAARTTLWLDYVLIVAYVVFLSSWLYWTHREIVATGWLPGSPSILVWSLVGAVVMAGISDIIENLAVLHQVRSSPTVRSTAIASRSAGTKLTLLSITAGLALMGTTTLWLTSGVRT